MYHDKERIATHLYTVLDNLILSDGNNHINIDNILNPEQKHDLIMTILNSLPKTDLESVMEFQRLFKVKKETTHVVSDFTEKELRFNLILEETLELGKALGYNKDKRYIDFLRLNDKVEKSDIPIGLVEVADALTDLLYVVNGTIDICNLSSIQYDLMEEVHSSNLSKLIPNDNSSIDIIKKTVRNYKTKGIDVISMDLKNGYIAICDNTTGKILKPITYKEPDLQTIINKHLNN